MLGRLFQTVDQSLDRRFDRRANIATLKREGDIGKNETILGAAIEGLATEMIAGELLRLGKRQHAVRQLDFIAGTTLLIFENVENLGLKYNGR